MHGKPVVYRVAAGKMADEGYEFFLSENGKVSLESLMKKLGEMNIDSVIVEGGGTLNWSMVSKGLVNKTEIYIAPKIFGGKDAKTPVEGQGFKLPAESLKLEKSKVSILGEDILIESYIKE